MFGLDPQQFASIFLVFFYVLTGIAVYLYHTVLLPRLSITQQARVQGFVQTAVKATAQVLGDGTPADKRQHALKAVEDLCTLYKVKFDPQTVMHFIEAAVLDLKTAVPALAPVAGMVEAVLAPVPQVPTMQQPAWMNDVTVQPTGVVPSSQPPASNPSQLMTQYPGMPPAQARQIQQAQQSQPGFQGLPQIP